MLGLPPGLLKRTSLMFIGGAALQAAILFLAAPAKAQIDDVAPVIPAQFGIVITQTGIANIGENDVYETVYKIDSLLPVITSTWTGFLSGHAEFLSVESNRRDAFIDLGVITYSVSAPLDFGPLFITVTALSLDEGLQFQDFLGIIITNTGFAVVPAVESSVLATSPPLPFTLGYRVPGVIPAGVITDTFRIDRRSRGVAVENVQVVGQLSQGGIYKSVAFDGISCDELSITLLRCTADVIPATGAAITITIDAQDPGTLERFLQVIGDGQTLNSEFRTTVMEAPFSPFLPVTIDIQPGSPVGHIREGRPGKIPVAVLSTPDFIVVNEVNPMSLTFGRTGDEMSLNFCNAEDVNGDGFVDLICLFDAVEAGFQAGDTQGILKGQTFAGDPIRGVDAVRIVPTQ